LFLDLLIADRRRRPVDPETVRARELNVRTQFEMQLESERLAFLEPEVVHVRLRGDLDALFLDELLIRFPYQRFNGFLSDGFAEFLAYHRRRRFPRPEPWQPHRRRVPVRGFLFGIPDRFDRDGNPDVALNTFDRTRAELDLHASNITRALKRPYTARSTWLESCH
jgi:hypothetical protein